ncbi:MAG TPA: hypothetical protein VGL39_15790 [Jatrophihabitantaceae bacterium]|jgi:hypothetical protein
MTALTYPLSAVLTVVMVLVFAASVRRLLGLYFSPLRTLIAGLLAFFLPAGDIRDPGAAGAGPDLPA